MLPAGRRETPKQNPAGRQLCGVSSYHTLEKGMKANEV
nr:MAG TPA: hypothetical protein [Caudoviricetes sp.]